MSAIAAVLFFVSGAVSLSYEIVWAKVLALQFGHSAWSISTVVASFMGGLGLGSWWGGRLADRSQRPIRLYALLEVGIAVFGILSLPLLGRTDRLIQIFYTLLENQPLAFAWVRFAVAFLLLLIPTVLMGATLPILAVGTARSGISLRRTVGLFYGINTLGAAAGVILAGFFFLPRFGLGGAVAWTVGFGLAVALGALVLDARSVAAPAINKKLSPAPEKTPRVLLAAVFMTGLLAIFYEITWARLLAPVVGSSTYAFSVILSVYLLGIGWGSLAESRNWFSRQPVRLVFSALLCMASVSVIAGLYAVNYFPDLMVWLASFAGQRPSLLFVAQGILAALLMVPPTFAMGLMLPLVMSGARLESGSAGRSIGRVYAANTLGGIAGSLLAGFVLLPLLGVRNSMIAAMETGILTSVIVLLNEKSLPGRTKTRWSVLMASLGIVIALAAPKINSHALQAGVFRKILTSAPDAHPSSELIYLREGYSSTVSVYRLKDFLSLKVNGKTDASTGMDLGTQYLAGHLPLFFHPQSRKACIIGLASGATVRAVATHPLESIDVAELEPAMLEASAFFESINDQVLKDPRVRVHIEDGRTFLRYRDQRYDVISSEPSNPWIEGVSSLFSEEFYALVRRRLAPGGVFCQWIQCYEISEETLAVMLRTLADAFPHVHIFITPGADLVCIASETPLEISPQKARRILSIPAVRENLKRINVQNPYDLFLGYLASLPEDNEHFPAQARNRDGNLWLEYRAPIEMYLGASAAIKPLPADRLFDRFRRIFFRGVSSERVALGLGESLLKLRPYASFRIRGMIPLLPDPAVQRELERLARAADARWRQSN